MANFDEGVFAVKDAPFFEDFFVGQDFSDVPSVTLTDGMVALHQALFGDRMRLSLDNPLSQSVTGESRSLVNPALVCNLAIGQSTLPSQRVLGNLFYRGLQLLAPVFVGDTLTTSTKVIALRQNAIKTGRAASGMVALEIRVENQDGVVVLHFWRCPMIPCRDVTANTGHADDFAVMPELITDEQLLAHVPAWNFDAYRDRYPQSNAPLPLGLLNVEAADTVTLAPELVRMTLNLAMTHTDATRSVYGKRLVYGGHTIAMAAKQLSLALPHMLGVLAWYRCDHVGPVFEQDILSSSIDCEAILQHEHARIAKLHVTVLARRGPEAPEGMTDDTVLEWSLAVLLP
ncbi:MAG: MaoC family dehydratase [Proteobacteria bacterium]|jgi:2-methylfumaryl-CoA hydratase|nr:MaoC family dehydratase [Pseudomonadota bacterium]